MKRDEVKVPSKYRARVTEDAYRDGYMAGYMDKALTEGMICASLGALFEYAGPAMELDGDLSDRIVRASGEHARRFTDAVRSAEARMGRAPMDIEPGDDE